MTFPDAPQDQNPDSGPEVTGDTGTGSGPEIPAKPYADYLRDLPESVVPLVTPIFDKWDSDTGRKFQEVHSQYEPLKQYKDFADQGLSAEELRKGALILQRLNEDPRAVWEALGTNMGFAPGQGQNGNTPGAEETPDEGEFDPLADPRFQNTDKMVRTMAEFLVAQENQRLQAETDKQVEAEFSDLRKKHGDFDEEFVLTQMVHYGKTGEEAVQRYNEKINAALAQRRAPQAPTMLSSGGGIPTTPVDVSKMDRKETKSLVAEMLAKARTQEP